MKPVLLKVKTIFIHWKKTVQLLCRVNTSCILLIVFITLITSFLPAISTIMMQKIINSIQAPRFSYSEFATYISIYIFITILNENLLIAVGCIETLLQAKTSMYINLLILEKTESFQLKDFENSETYDLLQRAMRVGVNRLFAFFKSLILMINSFVNLIFFVGIIMQWRLIIIPITLICPICSVIVSMHYGRKRYSIRRNRVEEERQQWYYQYLLTRDTAFKELKIYKLRKYLKRKYQELSEKFYEQDRKNLVIQNIVNLLLCLFDGIVNSTVFVMLLIDSIKKIILIGDLTTYMKGIANIKMQVKNILLCISTIYEDTLYVSDLFLLLDRPTEKYEHMSKNEVKIKQISSVKIENLSFTYYNSKKAVFSNLNLEINTGDIVAFVGRNGSGKSSLIKILTTLYTDYEGRVLVNGEDLKRIDKSEYIDRLAVLFQDYMCYQLPLRENIAFGQLSEFKQEDKIWEVLSYVGMKDKFEDLDSQLGTWFKGGKQLSGGEWLKIATCRTFFKNADVYILDEPNAALDSMSEKYIFNSLKKLFDGKIGIIITHRVENVRHLANKIVVFSNGQVEATGSHAELLKISKTYRDLYYSEIKKESLSKKS